MKHLLICCAALFAGLPAGAQQAEPTVEAAPPTDPARLAAARTTIDFIWPPGTYVRMTRGAFDQVLDGMMQSLFATDAEATAGEATADPATTDAEPAAPSLRDIWAKSDPHFEERLRIMKRVMEEEFVPTMAGVEPELREGMARAYARKFTASQLAQLNGFFSTPTGQAYASESMMLFVDPEVASLMNRIAPRMETELPRIMEKVTQAWSHLPPLPPQAPDGS